eukprot:scaffold1123_cov168-Amphora_coffeaeformis.AAC.22
MAMPKLRDPQGGWKNFAALLYSLVADVVGLLCLIQYSKTSTQGYAYLATGIFLSAHGRVIASYLVHEAAHASVFLDPAANRAFGIACLWLAGCPYADFAHVKSMHISHHKDRADSVEFEYRQFCNLPVVKHVVLALEFCFVPMVEIIMHVRTALYPILCSSDAAVTPSRWKSAWIGTPVMCAFYLMVWHLGGYAVLVPHLIAGACVLHFLALNDAFQHTYEVITLEEVNKGPGNRTAKYEEDNTYSTVMSVDYPWLNLLVLNFGYHNAHHTKAITPWYNLPKLHYDLYGEESNSHQQVLPFPQLLSSWYHHRLRRVLDEDYGVVHSVKEPDRARDFIGSLGVSFLTV